MIRSLLSLVLGLALTFSFSPLTEASTLQAHSSANAIAEMILDDPADPPTTTMTSAESRIATRENIDWFDKLITLNPEAFIVINFPGIGVFNPNDTPLILPGGPVPADVTLSDPAI